MDVEEMLAEIRKRGKKEDAENERIHKLKMKKLADDRLNAKIKMRRKKNLYKERTSDDVLDGIKGLDWTISYSRNTQLRNRVLFDGRDEVFDSRFLYQGCASREGIDIPLFEEGVDDDKDKWTKFRNCVARVDKYRKEQIRLRDLEKNMNNLQ